MKRILTIATVILIAALFGCSSDTNPTAPQADKVGDYSTAFSILIDGCVVMVNVTADSPKDAERVARDCNMALSALCDKADPIPDDPEQCNAMIAGNRCGLNQGHTGGHFYE